MSNPIFDDTFPIGWEQRGESRVATIISVGELSIMLDDYFGDRIKFNLGPRPFLWCKTRGPIALI